MTPDLPLWVLLGLVLAVATRALGKLRQRLEAERAEAAWWAWQDVYLREQPGPTYPEQSWEIVPVEPAAGLDLLDEWVSEDGPDVP